MKFNFKRGSATKPGPIHRRVLITPEHTLYPYFYDSLGRLNKEEVIKQKFASAPEEVLKLAAERGLDVESLKEKKTKADEPSRQ